MPALSPFPEPWPRAWLGTLPSLSDRDLLTAASLAGLTGGSLEIVVASIGYWGFHRISDGWVTGEMLWLTPLVTALLLLVLGAVALLSRRVVRAGPWWNALALFLVAALATYSLVRTSRLGLQPAAHWLLAAGAASLVVRSIGRRPVWLHHSGRRGTLVAFVLVGAWGAVDQSIGFGAARTRPVAGSDAAADTTLNVLLLVWDTARARSLSLYGYQRQTTPNLDRFAERAVVFDAASAPAPWTLPSHASLFTGLYRHQHGAGRDAPLPDTHLTLAEAMAARGYRSAGFVANTFWAGRAYGLDRGFEWYQDRWRSARIATSYTWSLSKASVDRIGQAIRADTPRRASARLVTASFLEWVDQAGNRPFFAFLNWIDAHDPYLPPDRFGFRFAEGTPLVDWKADTPVSYTPGELGQFRDAYDSCIYYLDHQFGVLLAGLEARGLLANTIVIVTADHGETLGEHQADLLGHDNNIYADALEVPLVIYAPAGIDAGSRRAAPVGLADLPATIIDLVRGPDPNPFPGVSLAPALRPGWRPTAADMGRMMLSQLNPADWQRTQVAWPVSRGPLYSLLGTRWHYIVEASGTERLYDLQADPWEARDLGDDPAVAAELAAFRAELQRQLGGDPP